MAKNRPTENTFRQLATVQRIQSEAKKGTLGFGDIAGDSQNNENRQEAVRRFFLPKINPKTRFLDLGCGSFASCAPVIRFLDRGYYYGLELHQEFVDAGLEYFRHNDQEISEKLCEENIIIADDFSLTRFNTKFDVIVSLSVFTHATLAEYQQCMDAVREVLSENGVMFFTYCDKPLRQFQVYSLEDLRAHTPSDLRLSHVPNWCPDLDFTLGNQEMASIHLATAS